MYNLRLQLHTPNPNPKIRIYGYPHTYQLIPCRYRVGAAWAQIFSLQWVHASIWTFGTACVLIGLGDVWVPYNFAFILCSAILGGWNTDLADPSYYNFYKIFPFLWVNNVEKYILYGALPASVNGSVGIVLAQSAFFIILYFWINYQYYNMEFLPSVWLKSLNDTIRSRNSSCSGGGYSSSSNSGNEQSKSVEIRNNNSASYTFVNLDDGNNSSKKKIEINTNSEAITSDSDSDSTLQQP